MTRLLYATAAFLSRPAGFWSIHAAMALGALLGLPWGFGEAWQLPYTLGLSVLAISLSMVLLIAQSRESKALHVKLDELLITLPQPRSELARLEDQSEDQIEALRAAPQGCETPRLV